MLKDDNASKQLVKDFCENLHLSVENIPILPETYQLFEFLNQKNGLDQEIEDIVGAILEDPFLSLKILIFLGNARKDSSVVIEGMRRTVMMMGMKNIFEISLSSSVLVMSDGLKDALWRGRFASEKAGLISVKRADIAPDEVQLSTLLADLGELILWIFKPEVPSKVRDLMVTGTYNSNATAQLAVCGFSFKDLSIELSKYLKLPDTLVDLLADNNLTRSKIARGCINLSRHIRNKQKAEDIAKDVKFLTEVTNWKSEDILEVLEINFELTEKDYNLVLETINSNAD